jgi:hypothetical protein
VGRIVQIGGAWEVPWIGLYRGVLPRVVTWVSCGAFPVAVLLVLFVEQVHSHTRSGVRWTLAWLVIGNP